MLLEISQLDFNLEMEISSTDVVVELHKICIDHLIDLLKAYSVALCLKIIQVA